MTHSAEKDAGLHEWREQIGERVMRAMCCAHVFEGAICEICWGNTQRVCSLIERERAAAKAEALDRFTAAIADELDHPHVPIHHGSKVIYGDVLVRLLRERAEHFRAERTRPLPPGVNDPSP